MEGRFLIENWMTKEVLTFTGGEDILSVARKMASRNVGATVIVDSQNKPKGIFTERDVMIKIIMQEKDYAATKLNEVMTPDPIVVSNKESCTVAGDIIRDHRIRHLPVVDEEGKLVGIVSIKDLTGYFKKK